MTKEFWFTPNDYSPSYFVRVDGEQVTLLKLHDIPPEYPASHKVTIEQHHINYIESAKQEILRLAQYAADAAGDAPR
jgi:hypothetical protein